MDTKFNYHSRWGLTKKDLICMILYFYPHLKGSLYMCSKRDLIGEIKERKIFG